MVTTMSLLPLIRINRTVRRHCRAFASSDKARICPEIRGIENSYVYVK